jgi:propanediol utilization protein
VHITKEQAMTLFGHGLTPKRPLSQPGQYLANERVTLVGPKGQFENVAVLGPERPEGQVEISMTDGRVLGIKPTLRLSGDVNGTPGAVLRGPRGQVKLPQGVICAKRHIHLTPETAKRMNVRDKQDVKLQVFTERPLIFEDVTVRVSDKFADFVHLDYDEANACGFQNGDLGRVL